jgi:hypothetical protein
MKKVSLAGRFNKFRQNDLLRSVVKWKLPVKFVTGVAEKMRMQDAETLRLAKHLYVRIKVVKPVRPSVNSVNPK